VPIDYRVDASGREGVMVEIWERVLAEPKEVTPKRVRILVLVLILLWESGCV
jgi:hypothetical protein